MTSGNLLQIIFLFILMLAGILLCAWVLDKFHTGSTTTAPATSTPDSYTLGQYWPMYVDYAQVTIDCVSTIYSSCALTRPGELPQHMATYPSGIMYSPRDGIRFQVFFDRGLDLTGGLHELRYSTVPVKDIARKINQTLPNFFVMRGYTPYRIVGAKDCDAGRVGFILAPIPGVAI